MPVMTMRDKRDAAVAELLSTETSYVSQMKVSANNSLRIATEKLWTRQQQEKLSSIQLCSAHEKRRMFGVKLLKL